MDLSSLADIIVVDRVHHLHTFTDSPPNEFRLQETDSLAPEQNDEDEDDQTIMEKTHINVIPNTNESPVVTSPVNNKTNQDNPTIEKMTPSNDKDYKPPEQSNIMNASTVTLIPTNDPMLDGTKRFLKFNIQPFIAFFLSRSFSKNRWYYKTNI